MLQCELDQALPLLVSVKDGKNWKYIDFFYTPGNETLRDMIMEINLEDIQQTNHIQIKLETSYLFWDLDYAGMDFSENPSCQTTSIPASRISKMSNGEVAYELDAAGNIHLSDKEYLNLDFVAEPNTDPGLSNTYFLAGTGYYHDETRFTGKAQLFKLVKFSRKGAFDRFSRQAYEELSALIKKSHVSNIARN